MSLLTDIGLEQLRTLVERQADSAAPARRADEPPPDRRALRARAVKALWFGATMVAGFVWWELILARIVGQARVAQGRMDRLIKLAGDFRNLAIELGGVWIKLGQFLSSRVDLLPPQIIAELSGLQDAVPPAPASVMLPVIERELGQPIEAVFEEFDPQPVAAASFGQAYLATLRTPSPNGKATAQRVVVKVQRPHMQAIVDTDLRSLKTIAGWLKLYKPIRRRANLDALVREFSEVVLQELDYAQEAQHAQEFDRNFAQDTGVRVPKVYTDLTTRRLIVMKNVEDIKILDFEGLESAGVSRREVANKLFDTYLRQVFEHGFFHADPHPGNLFVQPLDRATARAWKVPIGQGTPFRLTYVDFGMMGRIPPAFMRELREFIIAVSLKDARRWTAAAQRMGFFLPEADLDRVEQAVGALFDRFWGAAVNDISNVEFGEMYAFATEFRDLLSSLPFQIPQNVLYLGRAANILAGMLTALDPAFNPWRAIQAFASGLAGSTTARTVQDVLNEGARLIRQTIQLPNQSDAFFSHALNGQLEVRAQLSPKSTEDLRRIEAGVSRLTWAVAFAALLVCGTLLTINALSALGAVCLALAAIAFFRLWLS
ncbi:ABC1 kinase family protein [Candidatus Roseilinea sp. NK_OTU-006]|jgi:predicted unusual protein kinase regulating ubiquinone biosynthesis (AarF/ABC1/UbiB family)|nr:AarF/UbiB family protein [Candidatus Roseilinea sp. NK_OTU-006]